MFPVSTSLILDALSSSSSVYYNKFLQNIESKNAQGTFYACTQKQTYRRASFVGKLQSVNGRPWHKREFLSIETKKLTLSCFQKPLFPFTKIT